MKITPEESEAYRWLKSLPYAMEPGNSVGIVLVALRRHVAAEMRLEWEADHTSCVADDCPYKLNRHGWSEADWERAAHEALQGENK